ncbi:SGNH/GDSL hydrolase family protein [Ligilactobacillus salivarius]|uniref:SGNH/GDSL hydrolase family protein n=1 Tax=Ligilactobacillus salivarius TaxID=1624 RepID=UPI0025A326F3|nr:SGNH/GDSL hydrolase family protein [Ligilactobacillus salivarius]MDM8284763.1 SGNH/GDSL hydrolase family protein [Ligilactobacillus salivarius]
MTVEYRDETPFKGDNHTPTELANAIRTKKYGEDVREPIAQLADKLSNAVLGQNVGNVVATPTKVFDNLAELQKTYPNGADGVMVTVDNGHKYFWQDNQWKDFGVYQSQGSKIIKSSDVFQSNINYDNISVWNHATFTINSDGSITIDDSETYPNRGIIFSPENITKYFNIKIVTQSLEPSSTIDFWKYNPNSSNGLGNKISDVTKDTNNSQMLSIPSDADRVMLAVHGRGTLKIKVSANDDGVVTVDEYSNLFKNLTDVNNLVDSEVKGIELPLNTIGTFTNATMTNNGSEIIATVNGNNGGFLTRYFTANSERVQIHVDGEFTQKGITFQINYVDTTSGKSKYFKVANISGGKMKDLTFDASSLIIYQHADPDKFRLLIQSNVDSVENNDPVGKITLRSLSIYNPNSEGVNNSLLYNYKLKKTLSNVIAKLDEFGSDISNLKTLSSNSYVTLPDGTKGRIIYTNGQLTVKNSIYKKILLLGNSLLLGLSTDGSHGAPFGLTASNPTKDWAYLLTQKLQAKYSSSVTVNKLHDAVFEQSESDDNSQNYINSNFSKAEKNNDLVIIQIGDNVNSDLRRTTFKANFEKLINAVRDANPTADILIAGVWFDGAGLQNWLLDFANNHNCMFAPLHDLYNGETIAKVGDTITFADNVQMKVYEAIKTHPGDKGHALIADRIYSTLYPK